MMTWRPTRAYAILVGALLGFWVALWGLVGLQFVAVGNAAGWLALLVGAPGLYGLIRLARARLVLTETGVTVADVFGTASCRREDLAAIRRLVQGRAQVGWWYFARRDGSTAIRTMQAAWPRSAIDAVAQKFSVPVEGQRPLWVTRYTCPACGFPGLQEPPERKGVASHEICPCCGFEFGETDHIEGKSYAAWRQQWVDAGMPWFAKQAGENPPKGWDPAAQVRSLTGGL